MKEKRPQAASESERPPHHTQAILALFQQFVDLKFSDLRNVSGIPFDLWIAFFENILFRI